MACNGVDATYRDRCKHLNAETEEDWYNLLDKLLSEQELRRGMGRRGREHSLANYTVGEQTAKIAEVFEQITTD